MSRLVSAAGNSKTTQRTRKDKTNCEDISQVNFNIGNIGYKQGSLCAASSRHVTGPMQEGQARSGPCFTAVIQ